MIYTVTNWGQIVTGYPLFPQPRLAKVAVGSARPEPHAGIGARGVGRPREQGKLTEMTLHRFGEFLGRRRNALAAWGVVWALAATSLVVAPPSRAATDWGNFVFDITEVLSRQRLPVPIHYCFRLVLTRPWSRFLAERSPP